MKIEEGCIEFSLGEIYFAPSRKRPTHLIITADPKSWQLAIEEELAPQQIKELARSLLRWVETNGGSFL